MTRKRPNRTGFTLIELVVVIAIIALLVSLLASGVLKAMDRMQQVQTSTDIAQLSLAVQMFQQDFGLTTPPPSSLWLCEDRGTYYNIYGVPSSGINPTYASSLLFFQSILGRNWPPTSVGVDDWNGDGVTQPPYILQGQQLLVFYAGGIPQYLNGQINMTGFNTSTYTPALASIKRRGPYFAFLSSRLVMDPRCPLFPVYQDGYVSKGNGQPYAFFSSSGPGGTYNPMDCLAVGASVYYGGITNGLASYVNQGRYQILSAGKDQVFGFDAGALSPTVLWSGVSGFLSPTPGRNQRNEVAGNDDQSNFSASLLAAGQQ